VVALIVGNKLYCANVGDARGIMCRDGKALDLSVDHKAKRKDEQDRIKSSGGYIVYGRVLGRLAISRAFGDFDCKNIEMPPKNLDGSDITGTNEKVIRSFILSVPEIRVVDLDPRRDDFLLLASDGLFDRFTSQECVKLVRSKLKKMQYMEQSCQQVCQEIVDLAKNKRMMTDNITVILVALNRGIETEENT
jgi:protein phosphatase 1G